MKSKHNPNGIPDQSPSLQGKVVALGVTGSIAAYKSAELTSRLVQAGAEVHVVMTRNAGQFITPLTLRTLSGRPVVEEMFADPGQWEVEHVALADRADLVLIAPATAGVISRLAVGAADDMLTSLVLAARCPVMVAPAMNWRMLEHPATQANLARLGQLGYRIIEPGKGWLACREEGRGRMAEPEQILEQAAAVLLYRPDLAGVAVLVTAGPTREPIDQVRFISNPSSGRMGFALAKVAAWRGAQVVLVTGPTSLPDPVGVETVRVETAAQMRQAVLDRAGRAQVVIGAAAVSDWAPEPREGKIEKRGRGDLTLKLNPTPDIMAELGRMRAESRDHVILSPSAALRVNSAKNLGTESGHQAKILRCAQDDSCPDSRLPIADARPLLVGFAAQIGPPVEEARRKLRDKRLDLVVANDLAAPGAGFGQGTNVASLVFSDGAVIEFPKLSKEALANQVLEAIKSVLESRSGTGRKEP